MYKFIFVTFGALFWGFYEMSGGNDFEPGWWLDEDGARTAEAEAGASPADDAERVARADTGNLLTQVATPAAAQAATAAPGAQTVPPELVDTVRDVALTRRAMPEDDTDASGVRETTAASSNALDTGDTAEPVRDVRQVDGNVVNMRTGPGTNFSVMAQLRRGDSVEVLRESEGWLKLRVVESNRIGWMADFLVTASAE
ncbi:SH3 domain-containing protein [Roseivivax jejudonensis]|uniref:SH3 domain-containing protein n=1 Tax=Roseivivax jejudonensis TaxID=1529041 RepID=UPI000A27191B|nr:SH3 domain-containing protein [Roseivivax jejudonensis]